MRQKVCKLAIKFALRQNSALVYLVFWFLNFFLLIWLMSLVYLSPMVLGIFWIYSIYLVFSSQTKTNGFVYTNAEITIVKSQFTFVFSFLKSTPTWKKYATDGSDYILIISNENMRSILIISYFQGPALRA